MKIFKELKKLGYIHYSATTIEELDNLPLNSAERVSEQALVLRWFREKYEYYYHIFPLQITASDKAGYRYSWEIYNHTLEWIIEDKSLLGSLTYEEAELDCLIKLIEITKTK